MQWQRFLAWPSKHPILWSLSASIGVLWTGTAIVKLASFAYLHFLRRSSLKRYKSTSPWALVTGASDGIGKAFAQELCHRGFNVILHGRNLAKLEAVQLELKQEFPDRSTRTLIVDVSDSSIDLEVAVAQFVDVNLKILINNVAGGPSATLWIPLQDHSPLSTAEFLQANCHFQVELTRILLPRLIRNSPALILNIGSFLSDLPAPYISTLTGSKAFGKAWSQSLEFELRADRCDVELLQVQVGMVSTSREPRPEGVFVPNARRMAQASLDKVGCGKSVVAGYWGHGLLWEGLIGRLPGFVKERLLMSIVREMKGKEEELMKRA